MNNKKTFKADSAFYFLNDLSYTIAQADNISEVIQKINDTKKQFTNKKSWTNFLNKLLALSIDIDSKNNNNNHIIKVPFDIIKLDGNSKIGQSIAAFSSLPGSTCPGAGECLKFCYSFRSWRFPAAFCRQAQNSILLKFASDEIKKDFKAIVNKKGSNEFTFRLYVDGDFSSVNDVNFWMDLLKAAPNCKAYGYSKSFSELLEFNKLSGGWPKNYELNLSGGHLHNQATADLIKLLPIYRGEFVAVLVNNKLATSKDFGTKQLSIDTRAELNKLGIDKKGSFICKGSCDSCTSKGPACGIDSFKGINIYIAKH